MKHLIVVAHPDDEILGCLGLIRRIKKAGENVAVAIMSKRSRTRESGLEDKTLQIHRELGIDSTYVFAYETMKFAQYDRFEITKDIENVLRLETPDKIYTHDFNDIHNDHRVLAQIVIEASKLPFRQIPKENSELTISAIYTIEIPSSTDWGMGFIPNSYVEIDEDVLMLKEDTLLKFEDVIRKTPHPRNYESFKALARFRGGQCGKKYAEAYKKIFELNSLE